MGVGYLHAVYVHCKINFEKNSKQKSENILDLISRQFNYSVSEKISKKTGKTRHFISRHLHFLRSQKKVYFSPKMPKSASSTVEKRVVKFWLKKFRTPTRFSALGGSLFF